MLLPISICKSNSSFPSKKSLYSDNKTQSKEYKDIQHLSLNSNSFTLKICIIYISSEFSWHLIIFVLVYQNYSLTCQILNCLLQNSLENHNLCCHKPKRWVLWTLTHGRMDSILICCFSKNTWDKTFVSSYFYDTFPLQNQK